MPDVVKENTDVEGKRIEEWNMEKRKKKLENEKLVA